MKLLYRHVFTFIVVSIIWPSPVIARGERQIDIQLSAGGVFKCYATSCADPDSSKISRVKTLRAVARNSCSGRFLQKNCERDKQEVEAAIMCYNKFCPTVACRTKNITTGECLSGYYFDR